MAYLEQCLDLDQRTYNSEQLAAKLEQERQVKLSADGYAGFCKKGVPVKRTRHSQHRQQDSELHRLKQADLETLELAAQGGDIDLKYLDESGFCLFSPVSYSYSRLKQQKRWNKWQHAVIGSAFWGSGNRGNSLSMLSLKVVSMVKAISCVIDWIAEKAAITLAQTGRLTVVVQDNSSIHKCDLVRQQWQGWQDKACSSSFYRRTVLR
jgi:hypothetical protein